MPGETSSRSGRLSTLFPLIPDTDLAQLQFYTSGRLDAMWGLGERPTLLVIDMTTGFIEDAQASTFVPDGRLCADNVARLLEASRAARLPIVFTRGDPIKYEAVAGSWLRGRGMDVIATSNSAGERMIVASLEPRDDEIVIVKGKPSAFFGTQLEAVLNYLHTDSLIVTGVTTSGCVRATVNDAFALNYPIVLPIECVADRSQISHQVELFDMAVKYADVQPLDDVLAAIATQAAAGTLRPNRASKRSD